MRKHNLGSFAAGEIPLPLTHNFTDSEGGAIDLTGFTTFTTGDGSGTAEIAEPETAGSVTYTWAEDDLQIPGKYGMLIWAEGEDVRLASDLILWRVFDGPGETPPL